MIWRNYRQNYQYRNYRRLIRCIFSLSWCFLLLFLSNFLTWRQGTTKRIEIFENIIIYQIPTKREAMAAKGIKLFKHQSIQHFPPKGKIKFTKFPPKGKLWLQRELNYSNIKVYKIPPKGKLNLPNFPPKAKLQAGQSEIDQLLHRCSFSGSRRYGAWFAICSHLQ